MLKQITHLVLIISLVGQFLLTPVMAMPRFLHPLTHISDIDTSNTSMKMSKGQVSQSSTFKSPVSYYSVASNSQKSEMTMKHGEKECDMVLANIMTRDGNVLIDCDVLCEMMGAEGCVSHYASGILIQAPLAPSAPGSSDKVQTLSWSTQTAEPATFNPPPIWTSLT